MTITALALIGGALGVLIGLLASRRITVCLVLASIPIAMIAAIAIWQARHPDNVTSTSALDYVFGPLWPSLGALAGFHVGKIIRWLWNDG